MSMEHKLLHWWSCFRILLPEIQLENYILGLNYPSLGSCYVWALFVFQFVLLNQRDFKYDIMGHYLSTTDIMLSEPKGAQVNHTLEMAVSLYWPQKHPLSIRCLEVEEINLTLYLLTVHFDTDSRKQCEKNKTDSCPWSLCSCCQDSHISHPLTALEFTAAGF